MELKQDIFEQNVKKFIKNLYKLDQFKTIEQASKVENHWLFGIVKNLAKELSLVCCEFKCSCGSEERLSWHHLITRENKNFMPFNKYVLVRHYYGNIIILCWDCHNKVHGIECGQKDTETVISETLIAKVREKYYAK